MHHFYPHPDLFARMEMLKELHESATQRQPNARSNETTPTQSVKFRDTDALEQLDLT